MIIYNDFEQRSIEWYEIKWGKIGGTSSKGLHVKGDTLFINLLSQHIEDFEMEDNYVSEAMQIGIDTEIYAQEYIQKLKGIELMFPAWIQSEENELLGISPDGITQDLTIATELKAFQRKQHLKCLLSQEVPVDNVHQLIHYFTVNNKLEKLYFVSYRPQAPKHFVKEITRETILNVGTEKTPKMQPVYKMVEKSKEAAKELLEKINEHKKALLNDTF